MKSKGGDIRVESDTDKEKHLRHDVRFFGNLLGETLIEQGVRVYLILLKK
jgi:hypothetical protein